MKGVSAATVAVASAEEEGTVDFSVEDPIYSELSSGERLIWSGTPGQGVRLRPADALMIPFSLAWGGFAIFWEYSVLHIPAAPNKAGAGVDAFMTLWGIPFVLIGLYLIVGRFFVDAYQRARTRYAVTDQRVLIVTRLWNKDVKSIALRTLGEMSLRELADGSGTITFGPAPPFNWMMAPGWPGATKKVAPAFEFVEGARNVYEQIRKAQSG